MNLINGHMNGAIVEVEVEQHPIATFSILFKVEQLHNFTKANN